MDTIIFVIHDAQEGVKSIEYLVNDIKDNPDAQHSLFFRFLMANSYYISKGETDSEGKRKLIGKHEVIFIPYSRMGKALEEFEGKKNIIFQKNCMIIAGDGEKPKAFRELIINWLLEKTEEITL